MSQLLFEEQKPLCQSCHPKEYEDWQGTMHAKATLDPAFQDALSKSANQAACLTCHTTGFDTGSGEFLSEGVTCEACHGPYQEGHPNAATMQLPMESETCHVCHQDTFAQWEKSDHAAKNIECFDCHMAHTQGLRTGSEEKLCSACHSDRQTEFAHATHGIEGVNCTACHMAPADETEATVMPGQAPVRNHNFKVGSDVCAGCHQDTIHSAQPGAGQTNVSLDVNRQVEEANRVPELEQEVTGLETRVRGLQNMAVVGMGLAFGVGGFGGLVLGIAGAVVVRRRQRG
jgi:hypothetical protein